MLTKNICKICYMVKKMIGEIIREARDSLGWNQSDLAAKIRARTGDGFTRAALAQIESGSTKNPKPRNLLAACDALRIDFRAALDGQVRFLGEAIEGEFTRLGGVPSAPAPPQAARKIPLLDWVDAGRWCGMPSEMPVDAVERWIPPPAAGSPLMYALRVRGDSMEDEFRDGDTIIVDPCRPPGHKSYVVARLGDGNEATFKQLFVDGQERYLKPLNKDWPERAVKLPPDAVICGVVVCKWKAYV